MSSPYLMYDGALVGRDSDLGKELSRWERPPGWRASEHPFPAMLYRAQHRPDGKRSVGEVNDRLFAERGPMGELIVNPGAAEQWTRRCQLTVNDESEKQRAYEQGWRDTPGEALEYLEKRDNAVSTQTAERHASDLRMSPAAQSEAAAVDAATLKHVPEITPEAVVTARKRGRPKKQTA